MRRHRWLAGALALALLAVLSGAACFQDMVLSSMRPDRPFDPAAAPAAPDYADPAAWSALPDREDAADASVPEFPPIDQGAAPADVFYVHPTSYIKSGWNGPVDDAKLNRDTDLLSTRIQASAFNGCCAVWAPRYRQANGTAFTHPGPDGGRALDLAFEDVRAAFRHFLARRDPSRPFLVAAHSQGSALALRLLAEEVSGTPLRAQLVAAWLVGIPIPLAALAEAMPDIPPCATPEQTGCVIGWNARGPGFVPTLFDLRSLDGAREVGEGERLCVNPQGDGGGGEAVFLDADPPLVAPGFTSARCEGGALVVELAGEPPRDFMSRLLDRALGEGNYHPIEYQLFYADIRAGASERLAAWTRAQRSVPGQQ